MLSSHTNVDSAAAAASSALGNAPAVKNATAKRKVSGKYGSDNLKSMSFYQTVVPVTDGILKATTRATKASRVFCIALGTGTLVCSAHDNPPKKHSNLDRMIEALDKQLQAAPGGTPGKTNFVSVSDKGDGKIHTLEKGDHEYDYFLNTIFDTKTSGKAIGRKHTTRAGVLEFVEEEIYDVVKKQKVIDTTSAAVGIDMTEALLGEEGAKYFYEFSDAVKEAFETLAITETKVNEDEAKWMASDEKCIAGTRLGNVYAAKNPGLGPPIKIGATSKATPFARLKELSSCLPHSFQLVASIRTANPFALEKKVHEHFAAARIKKDSTNRNTEFFMVSEEDVDKYFEELMEEES